MYTKMSSVIVNIETSKSIGKIVGQLSFRPDFLKREFISISIHDELKASMYFYAVGICHQTYQLANIKLNLFGWDFLEYGFLQIAKESPELLDANYINHLSIQELIQCIKPFFAEDHIAENCTLDRLEERAYLWREMAGFLIKNSDDVLKFVKKSQNQAGYFYENLKKTEAYADPLQKKTSFLMKLLEDAGFINFTSQDEIIPIMDYHMQRVLLRTGCVEVQDHELEKHLKSKKNMADDSEIRKACIDSMKIIAEESGLSVLKMNDVFYTMGRSCCNEHPLCSAGSCGKEPCTLSLAVDIPHNHKCIFESVCKGAKNDSYRNYWQPMVETHFY